MGKLFSEAFTTFNNLLYKHTILILTLFFCVGLSGALWNMSHLSSNLIRSQAIHHATLYAQSSKEARTLYSNEVVNSAKTIPGIVVTHDYKNTKGGIPIPATYLIELAHRLTEKNSNMLVRLYSDYPFPWRAAEGGAKDNFEREALAALRKNPRSPFYRFEEYKGIPVLRYAQADIMEQSCVSCHNYHPDSPKTDWRVGDVRGVLEIVTPLNTFIKQTRQGLRGTFFSLGIASILGILGLTIVMGRLRQTSQELEKRVRERTAQLEDANQKLSIEQEKSDRLLLNILPEPIADKLKDGQSNIADGFAEVTILFADIVKFTELSTTVSPTELVKLLNEIFTAFDRLTEKHRLEKIKTIGDAYMVVGGIPKYRQDHAEAIAEMAFDMQGEVAKFNAKHHTNLSIRIGINTGPVVAGVIGTKKFIYDLWGDAVNTASRMESQGLAGSIQVTESTYHYLRDRYLLENRGAIQVKGKGEMITYLLTGRLK